MKTALDIAKIIAYKYLELSDKELTELSSIIEYKRISKDELFLNQGQIAKYIIYVDQGMLRQFYFKDGRDITEHFTTEGFITFCIVSMFRNEPTQLMIEALEESVIYCIPYESLKRLSAKYPSISEFSQKILEKSLIISQEKADSWRFESANERYQRFIKEYPEAAKRASVNHIASYLLMTPESLSRVRAGKL